MGKIISFILGLNKKYSLLIGIAAVIIIALMMIYFPKIKTQEVIIPSESTTVVFNEEEIVKFLETIEKAKKTDTIIKYDTILDESIPPDTFVKDIITDNYKDSRYSRFSPSSETSIVKDFTDYLKNSKSTLGHISFSDSSNKDVLVDVYVDFPYGKRSISYSYRKEFLTFDKYVGIGIINMKPAISLDIRERRSNIIGGIVLGYDEKLTYGAFLKYKF